ncbi:MAG: imidazole glycerol phosphate synthase subunit HisH [Planctomycetota bacterium]
MSEVLVVPTGVANLASVLAGLRRAGAEPRVEHDPARVAAAGRVVLPGVGAFAAGVQELRERELAAALSERVQGGAPTLAVCLGLQLLGASSDESPGTVGLSCLDTHAAAFPPGVRAPQFGWNHIQPDPGCQLLRAGYAYFANSFRLPQAPTGWYAAWADHGGPFVAALEKGAVLACQFHPELSGPFGTSLLRRWLSL